jgi:hypothetical protein
MSFPTQRLSPHRRRSRKTCNAFTLSELLVAAALGLIVVAAAGSVLVSHIRTTTVQTVQLRFQNDWARVSNFIETEVGEGESLTATSVDPSCPADNLLFTINVPVIVGTERILKNKQISYYQVPIDPDPGDPTELQRCGPPINDNGTLNVDEGVEPVTRVLLTNARFTRNTLDVIGGLVEYNLTLTDPTPPGFNAPFTRTFPAPNQFVQAGTKANYIN